MADFSHGCWGPNGRRASCLPRKNFTEINASVAPSLVLETAFHVAQVILEVTMMPRLSLNFWNPGLLFLPWSQNFNFMHEYYLLSVHKCMSPSYPCAEEEPIELHHHCLQDLIQMSRMELGKSLNSFACPLACLDCSRKWHRGPGGGGTHL